MRAGNGLRGIDLLSASELTADGAARAAAMLTETIVRSKLQYVSPDAMKPFVMNTFRDVLTDLMGSAEGAATLGQIVNSREPENL